MKKNILLDFAEISFLSELEFKNFLIDEGLKKKVISIGEDNSVDYYVYEKVYVAKKDEEWWEER